MNLHSVAHKATVWIDGTGQNWSIAAGGITDEHIRNILNYFAGVPPHRIDNDRQIQLAAVRDEAHRRGLFR